MVVPVSPLNFDICIVADRRRADDYDCIYTDSGGEVRGSYSSAEQPGAMVSTKPRSSLAPGILLLPDTRFQPRFREIRASLPIFS